MLPRKKGRLLLESINRWREDSKSKLHENVLELKASNGALLTFSKIFQLQSVHIHIRQIKHVDKATGSTNPKGQIHPLGGNKNFRKFSRKAWLLNAFWRQLKNLSKMTHDKHDTIHLTTIQYVSWHVHWWHPF